MSFNWKINISAQDEHQNVSESRACTEVWMVLGLLARYLLFIFQTKAKYYFQIPRDLLVGQILTKMTLFNSLTL